MRYKVNEIFYSLQAEGFYAGCPAVFVRLSGCNLKCPWCDTKYHNEGTWYTKEELEKAVYDIIPSKEVFIVFTGGEPTLQLKEEEELFEGFEKHIETNGTNPVPSWIDWVTVSPKSDIKIEKADEVKVVYENGRDEYLESLEDEDYLLFLQPLELNGKMNIQETVDFILKHPRYRLSLQFHKMIGVR